MKEKLFLMLRNDKTKFILFVVSLVLGSYFIINEIFFIVFSILIISSIATYIHELGHYSVARIFGYVPQYFIVGTKQIGLKKFNALIKFKLFGTYFILNPFGHGGSVEAFTYMYKGHRLKLALICIAGPIANLLFGLLILVLNFDFLFNHFNNGIVGFQNTIYKGGFEAYLLAILLMVFFVNGIYFLVNLIPFLKGVDGWFISQLYKKIKDPDFYNINIHKEVEKSLVGNKAFDNIIEPIYNKS